VRDTGGVADAMGVGVRVRVAVTVGLGARVGVMVSVGVRVVVTVGVRAGVRVSVAVSVAVAVGASTRAAGPGSRGGLGWPVAARPASRGERAAARPAGLRSMERMTSKLSARRMCRTDLSVTEAPPCDVEGQRSTHR
jgi:hypothetical protein